MISAAFIQFLLKNWKGIALAGAVLFLLSWAYERGVETTTAKYEAILGERDRAASEALAQALAQAHVQARQAMEIERASLQAQSQTEQQFRTIHDTVIKYVEKTPSIGACIVDADGLRIWNTANSGHTTTATDRP